MKHNNPLIDEFKSYFKALHESDLSRLRELYAEQIVFKDPVHEMRGLVELEDYFTSLCSDLSECRFEYLDEMLSEDSAYVKWVMHFKHPRLGNRLISVRGVSHLKLGDKIAVGQPIGRVQNISARYDEHLMKNHIHYEIKNGSSEYIDPATLTAGVKQDRQGN